MLIRLLFLMPLLLSVSVAVWADSDDCAAEKSGRLTECEGGGGDTGRTFGVAVVAGDMVNRNNWVVGSYCVGSSKTVGETLSVSFRPLGGLGCGGVMIEGTFYHLFEIEVQGKPIGTIVTLWFSNVGLEYPVANENVHSSIAEVVDIHESLAGELLSEIVVNVLNVNVHKTHRPNKGMVVGNIDIGTIEFTSPLD